MSRYHSAQSWGRPRSVPPEVHPHDNTEAMRNDEPNPSDDPWASAPLPIGFQLEEVWNPPRSPFPPQPRSLPFGGLGDPSGTEAWQNGWISDNPWSSRPRNPSNPFDRLVTNRNLKEAAPPHIQSSNSWSGSSSRKEPITSVSGIFPNTNHAVINARDFHDVGGDFKQFQGGVHHHIGSQSQPHETGLRTLQRDIATGASHDSGERFPPPTCPQLTREKVTEIITAWVDNPNTSSRILWLYGPPSSGKTAIAQTVAEVCEAKGSLAASFFFSKKRNPQRRTGQFVFPTIAFQLAHSIPEVRSQINNAVQKDPTITTKSIPVQFEKLIVAPMQKADSLTSSSRLIILDGIDKCSGEATQQALLNTIHDGLVKHDLPFRFCVTSRPQAHIKDVFSAAGSIVRRIILDDSRQPDHDIRVYTRTGLPEDSDAPSGYYSTPTLSTSSRISGAYWLQPPPAGYAMSPLHITPTLFKSQRNWLQNWPPPSMHIRGVHIHPLLNGLTNELLFDLSLKTFSPSCITGGSAALLSLEELKQPATHPPITRAAITCDLIPQWPIDLEYQPEPGSYESIEEQPPITVGDILVGIHNVLQRQISHSDWAKLSSREEVEVAKAFTNRCRQVGPHLEGQLKSQGVKVVDYLLGKVWFQALVFRGEEHRTMELIVSV